MYSGPLSGTEGLVKVHSKVLAVTLGEKTAFSGCAPLWCDVLQQ